MGSVDGPQALDNSLAKIQKIKEEGLDSFDFSEGLPYF